MCVDQSGHARPADSCGQTPIFAANQTALFVEQSAMCKPQSFHNHRFGHSPAPPLDNLIHRLAVLEILQYLPDHDAGAFKSGFAMADRRISHDVFAQLNPAGSSVGSTCAQGALLFKRLRERSSSLAGFKFKSVLHAPNMELLGRDSTKTSQVKK